MCVVIWYNFSPPQVCILVPIDVKLSHNYDSSWSAQCLESCDDPSIRALNQASNFAIIDSSLGIQLRSQVNHAPTMGVRGCYLRVEYNLDWSIFWYCMPQCEINCDLVLGFVGVDWVGGSHSNHAIIWDQSTQVIESAVVSHCNVIDAFVSFVLPNEGGHIVIILCEGKRVINIHPDLKIVSERVYNDVADLWECHTLIMIAAMTIVWVSNLHIGRDVVSWQFYHIVILGAWHILSPRVESHPCQISYFVVVCCEICSIVVTSPHCVGQRSRILTVHK